MNSSSEHSMQSTILLSIFLFLSSSLYAQIKNPTWELIRLEHPGPEDFVYDSIYNRLIIPSGKRGSDSAYGVFQTLDLNDHSVKTLKQPAVLNSWISLGIKAAPFDTSFQYMTNASKVDEDITRIFGLSFSEDSVAIIERSLVKNDFPASINNLRWVEGKGLYITNLYKAKTMKRGFISNLKGEVFRADGFGKEAKVILNAQGPNSIGMIDSALYLTGSRERFLMRITENDEAEKVKTIPLVGGDNVTIDGNKFYTTGSPKVFEVVRYMSEKRETVGSFIYELISENGTLRCNRIILVHPSTNMGMVSVVSKHNGAFYCGQVRGSTILRFSDHPSVVQEILHPKKNKYTKRIYRRYNRIYRKSGVKMPEFCIIQPDILL